MWLVALLMVNMAAAGGAQQAPAGPPPDEARKGCEKIKGEAVDLTTSKTADIERPVRVRNVFPKVPADVVTAVGPTNVGVKLLMSESGCVEEATIEKSSSQKAIDDAVIAAVKQWRYTPARRKDGSVVPVYLIAAVGISPQTP